MKKNEYLPILGLILLILLYVVFVTGYLVPVYTGCDQDGYFGCAVMLAKKNLFHQSPRDLLSFFGSKWVRNDMGRCYPKYPPFYPVLMAGMIKLFGPQAGFYVNPLCAVLSIIGIYLLCRIFFPRPYALLGAFILTLNPVMIVFSIFLLSEVSSFCFILWSFVLFFYAGKYKFRKFRLILYLFSGLLLGCSTNIRYTSALMAIPVILLCLNKLKRTKGRKAKRTGNLKSLNWQYNWHRLTILLVYLAGLAIPCFWLAIYQWGAFGSPFTTGYSETGEQTGFAWKYVIQNLHFYVPAVMKSGLGPFFFIFFCGFLLMWKKNIKTGIFFLSWLMPLFILHLLYYWIPRDTRHQYGLRFFLPLLIPSIILCLYFIRHLVAYLNKSKSRLSAPLIITVIILCQFIWGSIEIIKEAERSRRHKMSSRISIENIFNSIPENSIVFSDDGTLHRISSYHKYCLYDAHILFPGLVQTLINKTAEKQKKGDPVTSQASRILKWQQILALSDKKEYPRRIRRLFKNLLSENKEIYIATTDWNSRWYRVGRRLKNLGINYEIIHEYDQRWQYDYPLLLSLIIPFKKDQNYKPMTNKFLKITGMGKYKSKKKK